MWLYRFLTDVFSLFSFSMFASISMSESICAALPFGLNEMYRFASSALIGFSLDSET